VHKAVYGTIRLRGRLDYLLDQHLDKGLESVPLPLLRVLRFGTYQMFYMGSVPSYAAVSQSAAQAGRIGGPRGSGLVNAVLRAVGQVGGEVERFPSFDTDSVAHLCTWGSHPRWLVDRWVARYGPEGARSIVEAGNRTPGLFFRPIGVSLGRAIELLEGAGHDVSIGPLSSDMLRLGPNTDPAAVLDTVSGIIQDPAAAQTANFVQVNVGERVADLCAAPGGKAIVLAAGGGWLICSDPSRVRAERLRASLRRLGFPERVVLARGEAPPIRSVDRVLVDAPCTGTGTLSRHPDARWRLGAESPAKLASLQSRILDGAGMIVRPGGRLVYATCALEPEENEQVVEKFLETHPDFVVDGSEAILRVFPGKDRTDGAYAARLRKKG
jgi:16S rRNA (cytosine967-C5)-methyltransferase